MGSFWSQQNCIVPKRKANDNTVHCPPSGTSINDVPHFLVIFDLPTYPVLLYNVPFLGLFWTPKKTKKRDVINVTILRGGPHGMMFSLQSHSHEC